MYAIWRLKVFGSLSFTVGWHHAFRAQYSLMNAEKSEEKNRTLSMMVNIFRSHSWTRKQHMVSDVLSTDTQALLGPPKYYKELSITEKLNFTNVAN